MKNFLNFLQIQTGPLKNMLNELKDTHASDTERYYNQSVSDNNKKDKRR